MLFGTPLRCIKNKVFTYLLTPRGVQRVFIFYPQTAVLPMETASKGVHPINFAYAHNEKPCPVTIDRILRYEGVQIVDCIKYRRIPLTFLPFRVMYGHYNSEGGIAVV